MTGEEGWATRSCARCGRSFACGANTDSCWCDEVRLTDEQRSTLVALKLTGCLCRECLEGQEPASR
jgi:hypothetical protein